MARWTLKGGVLVPSTLPRPSPLLYDFLRRIAVPACLLQAFGEALTLTRTSSKMRVSSPWLDRNRSKRRLTHEHQQAVQ